MGNKINLAVFISGNGTNLQAIIDSIKAGRVEAELKMVISDKKNAYGLVRAEKAGIENIFIDPADFNSRQGYEKELLDYLDKKNIDLVALAGFMRLLSPYFINQFSGKIMNIHPSLLPSFPGLHAQRQALEYGVKVSGCTVHFVDEGMDTGPIILQAPVPVYSDDTEERLASRIREKEHELYPEAIQLFAENRLTIQGRKVYINQP
ncbi:phosphoribosylglycinamide formyltransferase [Halothermothrix orenii]|uniref:Phosphoribosylglycinamide formyltransferase n=1 Tax=Halothermothrix orenii (strain H 168 / OCM 544 / DSM 9562) TaxID=373903 RepID=B8D0L9_HALOH|nr:phosphoribosylglycinamide formyltransferase [Halothermothrix orenii]ACL70955.1 phosphoribosylglycinamide formyltransferase [Halothermothrix orenii H 168]